MNQEALLMRLTDILTGKTCEETQAWVDKFNATSPYFQLKVDYETSFISLFKREAV